jgi:hypothetical protein
VLQDVAALAPPLIMCVAVIIGVAWLLKSQMAPKRRQSAADSQADDLRAGGQSEQEVCAISEQVAVPGDRVADGEDT